MTTGRETWRSIATVCAKESLDNLRDLRSMLVALVYPLMGPVLLGVIISMVTGVVHVDKTTHFTIPVVGVERAPGLVAYIEKRGAIVVAAPQNPEEMVRQGLVESVLIIDEDFEKAFEEGRPAGVRMVIDSSRLPGVIAMGRVMETITSYSQEVSNRRLAEYGLKRGLSQPISVTTVNVSRGANLSDLFLVMVPPFIIFTIFMGGVYLALDTTAGERERGSMEPLLINPVARWALMSGKFLAALLFTAVAVIVQLIALKVSFTWVGEEGSDIVTALSLAVMGKLFLTAFPLMMLAVALQMIIATFTKSFKEAQTYLGLLPLVPAMPGLALVFVPLVPQPWMMTIPGFAQTLLFGQLLKGEDISALHVAISTSVTTVFALVLCVFAARMYERESLIFGN